MPAEARGHVRKLPSGLWQLRYYDATGKRRAGGVFRTKTEALTHYRAEIEPSLDGRAPVRRDLTLQELADIYLERHGKVRSARTIRSLRERLKRPLDRFGDVRLTELERMTDEVADFIGGLPERWRHAVVLAFRQTLDAGIRYGYLAANPAKLAGPNPEPPPRAIRIYSEDELKRICAELGMLGASVVRFAAATGLRPAEWSQLKRRDVDRKRRILTVNGTKTRGSRREVPLTSVAVEALNSQTPRLDSQYLFPAKRGGPFDFENFRRRDWHDAIDTAGIKRPARIYDLRSTFISNALAHGLTMFETARIAGTSTRMIELHYGALLDAAHDSLLERLEGLGH